MTQTLALANRMTTTPDQVFVACNPLQPQEEMLAIDQMAETHGGLLFLGPLIVAAKAAAPYVGVALAGAAGAIIAYEWNSESSGDGTTVNVNVNNCNCDCDCCG